MKCVFSLPGSGEAFGEGSLGASDMEAVGLLHRKGKPRQETVERIYYRTPYDERRVFLFKTQLPL